jgi:ferredoxin
MCRMCDMLGEGQIWYLNPKNYAHRMYKLREPGGKETKVALGSADEIRSSEQATRSRGEMLREASVAKANGDMETYDSIIREINDRQARVPGSHVLPLQDAMKVMDVAQGPLGAMMCICRKNFRGEEATNLKEYSCLGLGPGMLKWERWPERYKGGVEFMSPSRAKEWLEYWNKRGYVHIIMQEGGDFIGGLCNCDYPTCVAIRNRLDYGLVYSTVKAEYVAVVDYDACNGCGDCVMRCQFGALRYEVALDKANIDPFKCFGCGLCETKCPRGAIRLEPRKSFPALANVW